MLRMRRLLLWATLPLLCLSSAAYATNLLQAYQQAEKHNANFQASAAQFAAAKENAPIAFANLLPALTATANSTLNFANSTPTRYNSNGYTLTLTQPLIDLSDWELYTQARIGVAQAAITYAQAQQQLIIDVATAYFNVLEAEDNLTYAETYRSQLQQQMNQTEQQYRVGLKAMTDVQATRANYETAIADAVSAKNALHNAYEQLTEVTGTQDKDLTPLSDNAPLIKPDPANENAWVNAALKGNLALQAAALQAKYDQKGIRVAQMGNGTVPGYVPSLNAVGTYNYARTHGVAIGAPTSSTATNSQSAALVLGYSLFNGGSTYFTVKQARYTAESSEYLYAQQHRTAISNTRQSYLNVLSDISQVKALKQAIISGESSLKAITAAYNVGTRTIVDLLTQQSNLYSSKQQYASARYQYILDSLSLKQNTGLLSVSDIVAINQWLAPATTTAS